MAEPPSTLKGTLRKKKDALTSRSLLHHGNASLSSVNSGRLSLMSNARLQKITSNSSERLSFVSKKEDVNDLENYYLEYNTYLLRKVQSRVLAKNREEKEENLKKCFVSLKWELEELLEKYVKLSKEIGYLKTFLEIIKECNQKIEDGRKLLKVLNENEFEIILKSLSSSLDHTTNQLQLVDIDKKVLEEAFSRKILGSGSEIEECLKKIDSCITKNKEEVSKIAAELVEIKKLFMENTILKERFHSVLEKVSNEILETYYELSTSIVKKAFKQREQYKSDFISLNLNCDLSFLQSNVKAANTQKFNSDLSELESPCHVAPNSSSTPQH